MTLLSILDNHRVLTTAQITGLLFTSADRALHRSTQLYQRGFLDRFRRWSPGNGGSAPWHWMMGPLGATLVGSMNDITPPKPSELRERRDRLAASPHLAHLIGVNGFFVELWQCARQCEDAELVEWLSERQATSACADLARPDGAGMWREGNLSVAFWFEYDNGTEDLARVVAKLDGYAHLIGSRAERPVLLWFGSPIREANFITRARRDRLAQLHVATTSAEYASVNGGPTGRVWSLGGDPLRVALCQLPTVSDGDQWDA